MSSGLGPLLALATLAAGCAGPQLVAARPAGPLLIRDARVFDVRTGTAHPGRDVLVEGGRIAAVRPTGEAPPAGAQIIEARGRTLIPGLVDAHCHVGAPAKAPWIQNLPSDTLNMQRLLYAGVTTIFDPGDLAGDAFDRREDVASGDRLGPRIFAAGPVFTAPGGHPVGAIRHTTPWYASGYVVSGMTRQVETPEEAREEVEDLLDERPDFIKLAIDHAPLDAPRISDEVAKAAIDAARAGGVRAVAHIGTTADALDAARAGVAAWIHVVYKERIPDPQIAELAAFGIPMVSTLVVFDSLGTLGRQHREPTALEREIASASELADFDRAPAGYATPEIIEQLDLMEEARGARRENLRRLYEAGVRIIAGSDSLSGVYHGGGLHRELALLAEAGLPPRAILRAATYEAARFLENTDDPSFGLVEPGKAADLVLLARDPIADPAALSEIDEVIAAGRWLERHPIDAEL